MTITGNAITRNIITGRAIMTIVYITLSMIDTIDTTSVNLTIDMTSSSNTIACNTLIWRNVTSGYDTFLFVQLALLLLKF